MARFEYRGSAVTVADDGQSLSTNDGQGLSTNTASLLWYFPSTPEGRSVSFAAYLPGSGSPYIGFASHEFTRPDGARVSQSFFGGSQTRNDDLPPRGVDDRQFTVLVTVLETEADPGGSASENGLVRVDYSRDTFANLVGEPFRIAFPQSVNLPNLTVTIAGNLRRDDAGLTATLSDSVNGFSVDMRGSCFGPYCEDIYLDGIFEFSNSRQAYITLFSFE